MDNSGPLAICLWSFGHKNNPGPRPYKQSWPFGHMDNSGPLAINLACSKSVASSLRGKLLHLSRACGGKSGRFALCSLGEIANGLESNWNDPLELELKFITAELSEIIPKSYRLAPQVVMGAKCWTDASFEPGSFPGDFPKMKLCAIVANQSSKCGVVCDVITPAVL